MYCRLTKIILGLKHNNNFGIKIGASFMWARIKFISSWPVLMVAMVLSWPSVSFAGEKHDPVTLSVRDTEISEVMEMLSLKEKVNILLSEGVAGRISVNLYEVKLDEAIKAIANAAGYEAERRGHKSYFIINREDVGRYVDNGTTDVRTFKLEYAKSEDVQSILEEHLSHYGSITELQERNMLVVEDMPPFLRRIEKIIKELDYRPKQILIEARILEVTLDENESFGVEWSKILESGDGLAGTRGLSETTSGFFVEIFDENLNFLLDALSSDGRTKTLSTPKLLTLENETSSVIVGNRLGYVNTVTINQVTTENTEFLESGVILEVTPSVGADGRIMLKIRPEISTGKVNDGIPSQDTTSVDTQLLIASGSTSFIGGLIKRQSFYDEKGVPILRKLPLAGRLFSRKEERALNTEIIVLITPTIVEPSSSEWQKVETDKVEDLQQNIKTSL